MKAMVQWAIPAGLFGFIAFFLVRLFANFSLHKFEIDEVATRREQAINLHTETMRKKRSSIEHKPETDHVE